MKTYIIQTGNYRRLSVGKDMTDAAVAIFKKSPPKTPSNLTRMIAKYDLRRIGNVDGRWHYIDTTVLLKKAGYKVVK